MNLSAKNLIRNESNIDPKISLNIQENFENFSMRPYLNIYQEDSKNESFDYFPSEMLNHNKAISDGNLLQNKRYRSNINVENSCANYIKAFEPKIKTESSDYESDCISFFFNEKTQNYPSCNSDNSKNNVNKISSSVSFSEMWIVRNEENEDTITDESSQLKIYIEDYDLLDDIQKAKLNYHPSDHGTGISKEVSLADSKEDFPSISMSNKESFPFKEFMNIPSPAFELKKYVIFEKFKAIKEFENEHFKELHEKFSEIYQSKIKQEYNDNFNIKKKNEIQTFTEITTEMLRKDEIDKKVNTIMKTILQILLNLLFNYKNIDEILNEKETKLNKIITLQKMTGEKVDVETLKEFHSKTLADICIKNSLITNKQRRTTERHQDLIIRELDNKTSFCNLFNMKFEVLLNLTFFEFSKSNYDEVNKFLGDYSDKDPNKGNYKIKILEGFYKRLTYLTSEDIIPNNKSKVKKEKKNLFKTSKRGKFSGDIDKSLKI